MKHSCRRMVLKNPFQEHALYRTRVLWMLGFMLLVVSLLLVRMAYLQIKQHPKYSSLSRNNIVRVEPIPPIRGLIYDRHGRLIADNISAHRLELIPEKIKDLDSLLVHLGELIELSPKTISDFKKRAKQQPQFAPIPLKFQLSEKEVALLSVNLHKFSGVQITAGLMRHYPQAELFAHVVGFVGRINEKEINTLDKSRYRGTHYTGKNGIEKFYENILQGHPGWREIAIDAYGRPSKVLSKMAPMHGQSITLTIDLELQKQAIKALGTKRGAIVAVDPSNGEILALVSQPSFDPNLFVQGISNKVYQGLLQDKQKPLFNRFLNGQYPPASTIKPHVGLAGLELGKINSKTTMDDPGWYQIKENTRVYRDWKRDGHGKMNLTKALRESCDTFYYELAHKLGIENLSEWLVSFGFGQKTNIDLYGENQGLVPNRAWKRQTFGQPWYSGETLITGIGQGYFLATPLQLAQSSVLLANHGKSPQLHLLKNLQTTMETKVKASQKHWALIEDAMGQVVHHYRGTAWSIGQHLNYRMAGKTGTAQVFSLKPNEEIKQKELPEHLRDHSLFIGFAPQKNPKIVIAVVVENNHSSSNVAQNILNYYLEPPTS